MTERPQAALPPPSKGVESPGKAGLTHGYPRADDIRRPPPEGVESPGKAGSTQGYPQADDLRRPPPKGDEQSGKATFAQEPRNDPSSRDGQRDPRPSAGAMVRQAREAQGLHLETLANIVKVPARKLQALEEDRIEDLHDTSFARALAQTVCRALKIDPKPVLASLPAGRQHSIERVAGGLNTPFRERRMKPESPLAGVLQRPVVWVAAALVAAAAALFFWPMKMALPEFWTRLSSASGAASQGPVPAAPASDTAASAASSAAAMPPQVVVDTIHSAPAPTLTADAGPPVSEAAVVLHASAESWIEVVDRNGQSLLARTLAAGDSVGINGALPMRVKIGNASGTALSFRGQPVDLAPMTRDNVARVELR